MAKVTTGSRHRSQRPQRRPSPKRLPYVQDPRLDRRIEQLHSDAKRKRDEIRTIAKALQTKNHQLLESQIKSEHFSKWLQITRTYLKAGKGIETAIMDHIESMHDPSAYMRSFWANEIFSFMFTMDWLAKQKTTSDGNAPVVACVLTSRRDPDTVVKPCLIGGQNTNREGIMHAFTKLFTDVSLDEPDSAISENGSFVFYQRANIDDIKKAWNIPSDAPTCTFEKTFADRVRKHLVERNLSVQRDNTLLSTLGCDEAGTDDATEWTRCTVAFAVATAELGKLSEPTSRDDNDLQTLQNHAELESARMRPMQEAPATGPSAIPTCLRDAVRLATSAENRLSGVHEETRRELELLVNYLPSKDFQNASPEARKQLGQRVADLQHAAHLRVMCTECLASGEEVPAKMQVNFPGRSKSGVVQFKHGRHTHTLKPEHCNSPLQVVAATDGRRVRS